MDFSGFVICIFASCKEHCDHLAALRNFWPILRLYMHEESMPGLRNGGCGMKQNKKWMIPLEVVESTSQTGTEKSAKGLPEMTGGSFSILTKRST